MPAAKKDRVHARLADEVKSVLASTYRQPLQLGELARRVGVSRYHLCRVFHDQTGLTLTRWMHRLRLNEALERVATGERDLSRLALDLGYSSHSHFTQAFRQAFGTAPSTFRQTATTERFHEMSKILTA